MKKKGIIILTSVVVVCALGLIVAPLLDWNVEPGKTSGNIAKSSRFSRKTADETALSNLQELILNDEAYKNGVVASYVVMQTRAKQFDALVDMSNEVAGDIKDFDGVLKDMNKAKPMIDNVCASLAAAGEDLNGAFSGENRPDLAQNTINASLAYTTLQKQNSLADRFIATTDDYLKNNEGSNELKFVRDQWVDYQRMTAALEGDKKAAEELQNKGYKLNSEQTASTLNQFTVGQVIDIYDGAVMSHAFDMDCAIAHSLTPDAIKNIVVAGYVKGDSDLGFDIDLDMPLGQFSREIVANSDIFEQAVNSWQTAGYTGDTEFLGNMDVVKNGAGEIDKALGNVDVVKGTSEIDKALGNVDVVKGTSEIDKALGIFGMVGLAPEVMRNFDTFVGSIPASSMETVGFDISKSINAIATGDENLGQVFKIWE